MSNFNFLQLLVFSCGLIALSPLHTNAEELIQPERIYSIDGVLEVEREIKMAWNTVGDTEVYTPTYDGTIPGPTWVFKPGDTLIIHTTNNLPPNEGNIFETFGIDIDLCTPDQIAQLNAGDMELLSELAGDDININFPHDVYNYNDHTHGLFVSPSYKQDDVFITICPGETYTYVYEILDSVNQGMDWYHPHKHGSSIWQFFGGMAGAMIIEGPIDEVPEIATAKDIVMVLQNIQVNDDGEVPMPNSSATNPGEIFPGIQSHWTINGQVEPDITMQPGEIQRWRMLNASANNIMALECEGVEFYLIAIDGSNRADPVEIDTVFLAPGSRMECLVKAKGPGEYNLKKLPYVSAPFFAYPEAVMANVKIEGETVQMQLPKTLPVPEILAPIPESQVENVRHLAYTEDDEGGLSPYAINGLTFDPNVINFTMELNETDEWVITSDDSPHPHHMHIDSLWVVDIKGDYFTGLKQYGYDIDPKPAKDCIPLPARMDNILIPNNGEIIARVQYKNFTGKSVLHCHILIHEALGMMLTFEIVPPMGPYYSGVYQVEPGDVYIFQWFGSFRVTEIDWIDHETLGWLYPAGLGAEDNDFWFYTNIELGLGWIWTNSYYYPSIWWLDREQWLYYFVGGSEQRWFYDFETGVWFVR